MHRDCLRVRPLLDSFHLTLCPMLDLLGFQGLKNFCTWACGMLHDPVFAGLSARASILLRALPVLCRSRLRWRPRFFFAGGKALRLSKELEFQFAFWRLAGGIVGSCRLLAKGWNLCLRSESGYTGCTAIQSRACSLCPSPLFGALRRLGRKWLRLAPAGLQIAASSCRETGPGARVLLRKATLRFAPSSGLSSRALLCGGLRRRGAGVSESLTRGDLCQDSCRSFSAGDLAATRRRGLRERFMRRLGIQPRLDDRLCSWTAGEARPSVTCGSAR